MKPDCSPGQKPYRGYICLLPVFLLYWVSLVIGSLCDSGYFTLLFLIFFSPKVLSAQIILPANEGPMYLTTVKQFHTNLSYYPLAWTGRMFFCLDGWLVGLVLVLFLSGCSQTPWYQGNWGSWFFSCCWHVSGLILLMLVVSLFPVCATSLCRHGIIQIVEPALLTVHGLLCIQSREEICHQHLRFSDVKQKGDWRAPLLCILT